MTARHFLTTLLLLVGAASLAGCATPHATSSTQVLPFDQAVDEATDRLVAQTQRLPAFLAKVEQTVARRGIVVDPMIDAQTGQQTLATQRLQRRTESRIAQRQRAVEVLPFTTADLAKATFLLTGTLTRSAAHPDTDELRLALTDLKTGEVVAQASALARDAGVDHAPLPFYADSPVFVKDPVIEGYIRTTALPPGRRADPFYLERIAVASVISEATTLYDTQRYQESLSQYRAAAGSGGDQSRTLNGIYLNEVKLGRPAEAEVAFGRLVAYGIANRQLGVKFLFAPGRTEFWGDPRISGAYAMWLRQIARQATAAQACMDVLGHTSRTGSEQANVALSQQRAAAIRQKLAEEAPALEGRTRALGLGWRENIVGSGTDNAVDALDRRVEFRVTPCPG